MCLHMDGMFKLMSDDFERAQRLSESRSDADSEILMVDWVVRLIGIGSHMPRKLSTMFYD